MSARCGDCWMTIEPNDEELAGARDPEAALWCTWIDEVVYPEDTAFKKHCMDLPEDLM